MNYIQGYYDGMTRILVKASPECAEACPGILPHIPDVTYGQVADGLDIFFFFQAEEGIRDGTVTGVQTCALPISRPRSRSLSTIRWGCWSRMGKMARV